MVYQPNNCSHCGARLDNAETFCPDCGAKIPSSENSESKEENKLTSSGLSPNKKATAVVIVFVILSIWIIYQRGEGGQP